MNSYPAELLVQLAPVMFVAGLEPRTASGTTKAPGSPPDLDASVEQVPPVPALKRRDTTDQFDLLARRLREVLAAQRKPTIWVPESVRKSKAFQVVFVDEIVQFPPRKVPLPRNSAEPNASLNPRSPLSPLHPSSPLHPDGLIAPIWIRKHTTLVPSVFVLFLHLFENPTSLATPRSPLEPNHPDLQRELEEREREDRKHDEKLSQKIADRKKTTNERGIKLTVVLLASRRMLDDPALDARLTFIRRSSGLDSRAALFVLSPVSQAELADFVKSIQQALYDPALEYYATHSKRVRRKRNKHSQPMSAYGFGGKSAPRALPLRPEGWTVRYEYKMACFAEFRGEEEVALKHYQDSYSALITMFNSAATLAPRTKRWAEAKVLADSINIKICKLFLYNQEHALALSQFNSHVKKFSELSTRAWAIGEETFEFWSWIARQYRVLSELLEQGVHFSLAIPQYLPPASPGIPLAGQSQQEIEAMQSLGLNPSVALMHPGFYFYIAAECIERRRTCYLKAMEAQLTDAPGFQTESRVDHLASILELYTKAYELFKKHSSPSSPKGPLHGRFTLWIAYRIARTYYESGKYDMAVKFFERISPSYSQERWSSVLESLFSTWYACAQQLGDVEMSIRLLVQKIAKFRLLKAQGEDDEDSPEDDLRAVMQSTVPASPDPITVDLSHQALFDSYALFWLPDIQLGEKVAFQVTLATRDHIDPSKLPIASVTLFFAHDGGAIRIQCESSDEKTQYPPSDAVQLIDIGHIVQPEKKDHEKKASLKWAEKSAIVICGTVESFTAQELKIDRCEVHLSLGSWDVRIPFVLARSEQSVGSSPRWWTKTHDNSYVSTPIRRKDASSCVVKARSHNVSIAFSHRPIGYLGEPFPISVNVTNKDSHELEFFMDTLLQPGEDDADNKMLIDDQVSAGLIKGIALGKLSPGMTACKTIYLTSTGITGDRLIDFSIQSLIPQSDGEHSMLLQDKCESLQTLVIPTASPFGIRDDVSYSRYHGDGRGLAHLQTFDAENWDETSGGRALVTTTIDFIDCEGADTILIDRMSIERKQGKLARVIHCSLDEEDFPQELYPGDQFSVLTEVALADPEDWPLDSDSSVESTANIVISWRRCGGNSTYGSQASSTHSLPLLKRPIGETVALLNVPPLVHLHQPFILELLIRNQHPTRTVFPKISLELSTTESFVVAGLRSGRLPALISGAEDRITWQLVPLDCGPSVPLPLIKVTDSRRTQEIAESQALDVPLETGSDLIRIIPMHLDHRTEEGSYTSIANDPHEPKTAEEEAEMRFRVAVTPA